MKIDGYICERCRTYAPRLITHQARKAGTFLPQGWIEMSRYEHLLNAPRSLHWCSRECLDATDPYDIPSAKDIKTVQVNA